MRYDYETAVVRLISTAVQSVMEVDHPVAGVLGRFLVSQDRGLVWQQRWGSFERRHDKLHGRCVSGEGICDKVYTRFVEGYLVDKV